MTKKDNQAWNRRKDKEQIMAWMNASVTVNLWGKKMSFCPMKLAVVVALAAVVLSLAIQLLLIPAHRPRTLDLGMETGTDSAMQTVEDGILVYNNQGMKLIDHKGETRWSTKISMSSPVVEHAGDYILAADLGGNHAAALYKNGEQVREYQLGKDIISAKVNPKGMAVFATAADGYKGSVVVIDKKGKEVFRWNSGDGYIMDLDVSDNGHYLAVAQLSSAGTQADAKIQFIDLYRKEVVKVVERTGSVIGEIRFSGNRLLTVSDTELCGFSGSGRNLYSVSFAGKRPGKYDISSDDLLAFVTSDNRGNTVLELYNTRGKLKGSFLADSPISILAVHGDTVVAARQRDVLRVSPRGRLKKQITCEHDIKALSVFGNGKTVLAAGSTEADILWMR